MSCIMGRGLHQLTRTGHALWLVPASTLAPWFLPFTFCVARQLEIGFLSPSQGVGLSLIQC